MVLFAHGALGIWDEVVFFVVIAFLLAMMAVSWLRSREDDPGRDPSAAEAVEAPASEKTFKLD